MNENEGDGEAIENINFGIIDDMFNEEVEDDHVYKDKDTMISVMKNLALHVVSSSCMQWRNQEFHLGYFLQRIDKDFTLMKVLSSGVYHYQFIVDGQWRYAPNFPCKRDDIGNMFNVLDLYVIFSEPF
ncbi:SNF1-related protein kinase regulatory subunit beta-1-like [Nicotiana tomentosiformis]|uniref:SNF1-related protein kinase regulatory subunit beta-1-like n=1 Tax=Nicotiana tomentosiformis TaxID=4098 RepID=UPI00388CA4AF